jgi:hypothetical protein
MNNYSVIAFGVEGLVTRVIGYSARNGIVSDVIIVVFNRMPSVKFSIQR